MKDKIREPINNKNKKLMEKCLLVWVNNLKKEKGELKHDVVFDKMMNIAEGIIADCIPIIQADSEKAGYDKGANP